MVLGVAVLKWGIWPMINFPHVSISLMILLGTGGLIYLGSLLFLDRDFVLQTRMIIKKAASSQPASG
jgi:threonine aldolase